jgi:hypothetical protein
MRYERAFSFHITLALETTILRRYTQRLHAPLMDRIADTYTLSSFLMQTIDLLHVSITMLAFCVGTFSGEDDRLAVDGAG